MTDSNDGGTLLRKKILYVFIGVISILLGILCLFDEELPVILSGIGLFLYGIGQLLHWRERRKPVLKLLR